MLIYFQAGSWISLIFEWFVISMIIYFLVSIINSMAQSHLKQRHHQSLEKNGGVKSCNTNDSSKSENKNAKKD